MCHDGIYKSGQEDGIAQVRCHLAAFGQGARHNGGGCGGKGKLEQPIGEIVNSHHEEIGRADKGRGIGIILSTKGKGVSDCEETESSAAGIQQVL